MSRRTLADTYRPPEEGEPAYLVAFEAGGYLQAAGAAVGPRETAVRLTLFGARRVASQSTHRDNQPARVEAV